MYAYPDYLMHHGILGMHWGIRKAKTKGGSRESLGSRYSKYVKNYAGNRLSKAHGSKGKAILSTYARSMGRSLVAGAALSVPLAVALRYNNSALFKGAAIVGEAAGLAINGDWIAKTYTIGKSKKN